MGTGMSDETRAQALTAALHDILDARTFDEAQAIARRAVSWSEDRVLAAHDRAVESAAYERQHHPRYSPVGCNQ